MGATNRVLGVAEHAVLKLAFSCLLRQPAVASVIDEATAPDLAGNNTVAAGWDGTYEEQRVRVDRLP